MMRSVETVDWGVVDYVEALDRQRSLFGNLIARKNACHGLNGDGPISDRVPDSCVGWFVVCEHPHVYTLGRGGQAGNLLVSESSLRARGAALHRVERGGDITYHGPGQIVAYPILDLESVGLSLRGYVDALEQSVIDTVARYGVVAGRISGKTGVWVVGSGGERKICAIGVKASRGVVMHGLALNVSTDLEWFGLINPCGMVGSRATSIECERGCEIPFGEVKRILIADFCKRLGLD